MLSLSFWRDEAAVARWRNQVQHRATQKAGRSGVFRDYRLRVAAVVRDYGMSERREQAPDDSRQAHEEPARLAWSRRLAPSRPSSVDDVIVRAVQPAEGR